MLEDKLSLLIVEARVHEEIADALLAGARTAIAAAGAEQAVVTVPSALEIPAAIALAEEGGHRPAGVRYDGYVALGCIVRGETYAFEIMANESTRGLIDLSIGRRLAIGHGILAVDTEQQGRVRARADGGDKGGAAARACLNMIALRRRLLGQSR
ncbi:MAG TPA: 6,7-dimethyl-8-ribityllumazine synthase [Caulobacteraceae bacterium]|jgi:6,7-dimethyl-8-ribityllumazine synthase|nr:6,7-dimethyl-8-ribityllumazine synthase [Caulobacteraceae bacterium]